MVCAFAVTGETLAQTSLDEPLDEHSSKRLDRLEKAVKELRAIVNSRDARPRTAGGGSTGGNPSADQ